MLFSIAYNMLGTVADAEDLVQETYISWLDTDKSHVENVKFYLIRTITNKCVAHTKRLKKERETYRGTWLPEPILSPSQAENGRLSEDKLSIGFLYLLEKLNPVERGVIILKEAFDVDHTQISEIFNISYDNSRQHLSRAKKKLAAVKTRRNVNTLAHKIILQEFLDACLSNRPQQLINLLQEDVIAYFDGGGTAKGILKPIYGKDNVSRLFTNQMDLFSHYNHAELIFVNGILAAALYQTSGQNTPDLLIAIDTDGIGTITDLYFMSNPQKIKPITE